MKSVLTIIAVLLLVACTKDDDLVRPCACIKYSKTAYDIYNVEDVPFQTEKEGIDENGKPFKIVCDGD